MRGTAEGADPGGENLLYLRTAKSEVWLAAKQGMRRWVRRKESWFSQWIIGTKALLSWTIGVCASERSASGHYSCVASLTQEGEKLHFLQAAVKTV